MRVADVPSGLFTTTFVAPSDPVGAIAVIFVPLLTVTPVAGWPPTVTSAPSSNPLPVMVTGVSALVSPLSGVMLVKVGGGPAVTVNVPLVMLTA